MLKKLLVLFVAVLLTSSSLQAQYLPERGEWFHFSYSLLSFTNTPPDVNAIRKEIDPEKINLGATKIEEVDMSEEEIAAYMAGYNETTDMKDWG